MMMYYETQKHLFFALTCLIFGINYAEEAVFKYDSVTANNGSSRARQPRLQDFIRPNQAPGSQQNFLNLPKLLIILSNHAHSTYSRNQDILHFSKIYHFYRPKENATQNKGIQQRNLRLMPQAERRALRTISFSSTGPRTTRLLTITATVNSLTESSIIDTIVFDRKAFFPLEVFFTQKATAGISSTATEYLILNTTLTTGLPKDTNVPEAKTDLPTTRTLAITRTGSTAQISPVTSTDGDTSVTTQLRITSLLTISAKPVTVVGVNVTTIAPAPALSIYTTPTTEPFTELGTTPESSTESYTIPVPTDTALSITAAPTLFTESDMMTESTSPAGSNTTMSSPLYDPTPTVAGTSATFPATTSTMINVLEMSVTSSNLNAINVASKSTGIPETTESPTTTINACTQSGCLQRFIPEIVGVFALGPCERNYCHCGLRSVATIIACSINEVLDSFACTPKDQVPVCI